MAIAITCIFVTPSFGSAQQQALPYARPAGSASTPARWVINLRASELSVFAEQVSNITGRTLILDPSVHGKVTVISAEPLDAEGVWALFQSVLRGKWLRRVERRQRLAESFLKIWSTKAARRSINPTCHPRRI